MNKDIRLSVSFLTHRKRKKLHRKLGAEGVLAFIDLLLNTAMSRPKGILFGMDEEDIALDAQWDGDAIEFVSVLIEVGFLEKGADHGYKIHDWEIHNAFAAHADERSERARTAAAVRWKKNGTANECGSDADSMQDECGSDADSMQDVQTSNAPSPSPSPSPSPTPSPNPIPYKEIILYLNEKAGKDFKLNGKDSMKYIKARWNDGFRLDDFKYVIDVKFSKWASDPKMKDYLRPSTLFSTKFEGYRNEKTVESQSFKPKFIDTDNLYD